MKGTSEVAINLIFALVVVVIAALNPELSIWVAVIFLLGKAADKYIEISYAPYDTPVRSTRQGGER